MKPREVGNHTHRAEITSRQQENGNVYNMYDWYMLVYPTTGQGGYMYTDDSVNPLRPRQMVAIFNTTFSNTFSWQKM